MDDKKLAITSYETLFNNLITGRTKITDLNADLPTHRKAGLAFVRTKPSSLKLLSKETDVKLLKYFIEQDKNFFIYLDQSQYNEYIANLYLCDRISKSKNVYNGFISKNYDRETVFNLDYVTCEGEEIIYFDTDLGTTTFLHTKINVSFKVSDTIKFFRYVNVAIENIGFNSVKETLTNLIMKAFQKTAIKLVNTDKLGIYKLNTMHSEIETEILETMNKEIIDNGVVAEIVNLRKLSVSEATSKIIEKQDLEILSVQKIKKVEAEYERAALENYAKKAEIHKANPAYEVGLTEAEKDLALNRYIKKRSFENGLTNTLPENTDLAKRVKVADNEVEKVHDKPIEVKVTNYSVIFYVLAGFIGFIALVGGFGAGGILVCLGIAAMFVGLGIIANNLYKKKLEDNAALNAEYEEA